MRWSFLKLCPGYSGRSGSPSAASTTCRRDCSRSSSSPEPRTFSEGFHRDRLLAFLVWESLPVITGFVSLAYWGLVALHNGSDNFSARQLCLRNRLILLRGPGSINRPKRFVNRQQHFGWSLVRALSGTLQCSGPPASHPDQPSDMRSSVHLVQASLKQGEVPEESNQSAPSANSSGKGRKLAKLTLFRTSVLASSRRSKMSPL